MSIPLKSTCSPDDPEEHVLWALVGLAGPNSHAPLILPAQVARKWSAHLYECGFRHHPDLQKIKYVPPSAGTDWVLGAAGKWVDINTPLTPDQTAPNTSHLSQAEKAALLANLQAELAQDAPRDDGDTAQVNDD